MKHIHGKSVNGAEDHWTETCPDCGKETEFEGFFDSEDITLCECGCIFNVDRIWIDDKNYIG